MNQIWTKFESHWQNLRFFFSISGVKFFVAWFAFAPIVVKLLEKMPRDFNILINGDPFSLSLELPFSWVVLWFSSFLYSIALILYHSFCPGFIKRNPDFSTYKEAEHSPRWIVWNLFYSWSDTSERTKLAERLIEKKLAEKTDLSEIKFNKPNVQNRGTVWQFEHKKDIYEVCAPSNLSVITEREYFWEVFGRYSNSRKEMRYTIWGLILVSGILVVFVVIQNIWFVLKYLYSQLI